MCEWENEDIRKRNPLVKPMNYVHKNRSICELFI